MRTALLVPSRPSSWTPPIHEAIRDEFSADIIALAPDDRLPDLREYDLVISRLKFRHLAAMASDRLDWGDSPAFKVHWEEDGFWDGLWSDPSYQGLWTRHLPRLGFDLLVVTGLRTRDYFEDRGIVTRVVHKGFPGGRFRDHEGRREPSLAMYGQDYLARSAARRRLTRGGLPVHRLKAPFDRLPDELRQHLAALVCTLDATVVGGRRLRRIAEIAPSLMVRTAPGPEPMLKLFESAASGCATFTDATPDLEHLGFIDGSTAVVFEDIDDLVAKAEHYFQYPDLLRSIGRAGAELCAQRHTWINRARELRGVIAEFTPE